MEHGVDEHTLVYFSKDPIHRPHHHHELTFALLYAFTEKLHSCR